MKKLLLICILIVSLVFTSTLAFAKDAEGSGVEGNKFTDIAKHWAEEAINKIADKDQFAGKDGKFLPNKAITRSEFVLMLQKALGIQFNYFKAPDIGEYYDDVKNEEVYASALYDLATAGIIDYRGHFKPNSTLPREEMVHFIMNAYRFKMGENYKQIKMVFKPFKDQDRINSLFGGDIGRAEYMGLIARPANNKFYPKDNTTRAQAAAVINRLLGVLEKEKIQVQVMSSAEVKDGTLQMKLTITNNLKTKIVLSQSSGQKYDFTLLDEQRKELYRWSTGKMFTMMLTETVIEPGKSMEFIENVDKETFRSLQGKAVYMKAYIIGKTGSFTIRGDGYETNIKK